MYVWCGAVCVRVCVCVSVCLCVCYVCACACASVAHLALCNVVVPASMASGLCTPRHAVLRSFLPCDVCWREASLVAAAAIGFVVLLSKFRRLSTHKRCRCCTM